MNAWKYGTAYIVVLVVAVMVVMVMVESFICAKCLMNPILLHIGITN